jgi:hypothetical protein
LAAAVPGVGVRVAKELGAEGGQVELRVCQRDSCYTYTKALRPAEGLPEAEEVFVMPWGADRTAVTVRVRGRDVAVLADGTLTFTPKVNYPNGKGCGGDAPYAVLAVDATGKLSRLS